MWRRLEYRGFKIVTWWSAEDALVAKDKRTGTVLVFPCTMRIKDVDAKIVASRKKFSARIKTEAI